MAEFSFKDNKYTHLDDDGGVNMSTVKPSDLLWVQYALQELLKEKKIAIIEYYKLITSIWAIRANSMAVSRKAN